MAKVNPSQASAKSQAIVPDGWATVDIQRYRWNLSDGDRPLQGHVVDVQELPGKDGDEPYNALVIHTTKLTQAKIDTGEVVDVEPGTFVIVSESAGLKPVWPMLVKMASNPNLVHEIILQRSHQVKTPAGNMWKIKSPFAYNPAPVNRETLPPTPQYGLVDEDESFEPAKLEASTNGQVAFPAT